MLPSWAQLQEKERAYEVIIHEGRSPSRCRLRSCAYVIATATAGQADGTGLRNSSGYDRTFASAVNH
jgi:hypothetical protein